MGTAVQWAIHFDQMLILYTFDSVSSISILYPVLLQYTLPQRSKYPVYLYLVHIMPRNVLLT